MCLDIMFPLYATFSVADTAASGSGVGGLAFIFHDGTMILHDLSCSYLHFPTLTLLTYPLRVITPSLLSPQSGYS